MELPTTGPAEERAASHAAFATTRWTIVLNSGDLDAPESRRALEELCRTYWRPIYAFVRRLGHSSHDAQDLTQEFFARLLTSGSLHRVDPAKGRFRSFLLASLKNFLANEWDKAQCLKRGRGAEIFPLDTTDAENACPIAANPNLGPERVFDRQWALALLDQVLNRLRTEFSASGKSAIFEELKDTLTRDRASLPYSEIAKRLAMSEGAVKVAVHRLRSRYRELLRIEIAATLEDPGQVDEELKELFSALTN